MPATGSRARRWWRPQHPAAACRNGSRQGVARQCAAWIGHSGSLRLKSQGFPGATASGRRFCKAEGTFEVTGPAGQRRLAAADFFVLPSQNPARENVLAATELLTGIRIPTPAAGVVSTYLKVTDREAWTHAEVSVAAMLNLDGDRIRTAGVVLGGVAPIPWRLTAVEHFLSAQTLSAAVAGQAGALAIADAQPLAKNGHKLPMTSAAVESALMCLAPA